MFVYNYHMKKSIGCIVRAWRKLRRYSQLQLAIELGISGKHVSFIETGRSIPSRAMILKIGAFLFLPKREINRGLCSAGYAPAYAELPIAHDDLTPVFNAIDQMLINHMPYPAIVLNQDWDLVKVNESAKKLLFDLGFYGHINLIEALISDNPESSKIVNWYESASLVLMRLRNEISMLGGSERLEELEGRLASCINSNDNVIDLDERRAILPIKFHLYDGVLSFFSIISQLGTIQDVTVSEFRIELMFPSDESTKEFYRKNSNFNL